MTSTMEDSPLYRIARPRSIAIFGASNRSSAMGTGILKSLQDLGFPGSVYPVHPREETVMGLKAYADVQALPEIPDLAVFVLPTPVVPETMEACGKKGIRRAIVVSGGFREVGGNGPELEKKIVDIAHAYGIRFIGPNCIGVANPHAALNLTYLPFQGTPGFIGMASQSGSFITQMFDYLSRFGLNFSTGFSVGNEANIDLVDCIEYLGDCPDTRVIGLYVETIRRGRAFIDAARVVAKKKPIVAFYVGGSDAGKRASFSHTGALSGPDRLYDGVFHQSGVIRAKSIAELYDFCWVLGSCPVPKGNRVVIQTHSGGPGAAAADACSRQGMEVPPLSRQTVETLKNFVPHTGSVGNPVDVTFSRNPLDFFDGIPRTLLSEQNADALLAYFLMPRRNIERGLEGMGIPPEDMASSVLRVVEGQSRALADLCAGSDKPLIGFSFHSRQEPFLQAMQHRGIPVLPGPDRAARALGALVNYGEWLKKTGAEDSRGRGSA